VDRRRLRVLGAWLGTSAILVLAAACGTTSSPAQPQPRPLVSCEPDASVPPSPLRCEAAVAAATAALPLVRPPIARIEFRYGFACLPNSRAMKCLTHPPEVGNVVITYVDRRIVMVAVRAEPDGDVNARSPQEWDPDGIDVRLLPG
jgi:hypothetical protein